MSKRKKNSYQPFRPPLRPQPNIEAIGNMAAKIYDEEMIMQANKGFNLGLSSILIAAKDLGYSLETLEELTSKALGIMYEAQENMADIENMMNVVESWTIPIYELTIQPKRQDLNNRNMVWTCLEYGMTEIGQIQDKCKEKGKYIEFESIAKYRWEYDRIKYTSEEAEKMANKKKEKAYALLDEGADAKILMNKLQISGVAAQKYIDMYNEEKSDGETKIILETTRKQIIKMINKGKSNEAIATELMLKKSVVEDCRTEYEKENKKTEDKEMEKSKVTLRKIVRYEGEVASYIPDGKKVEINIKNSGETITLTADQLVKLVEEISALADEIFK